MARSVFLENQVWERAVPKGHLACVITYLQRTQGPRETLPEVPAGFSLKWEKPLSASDYRAMFIDIGAPWLWTSRLMLTDEALHEILRSSATHIGVLFDGERRAGFVELTGSARDVLTLSYLAVTAGYEGRGLGAVLLEHGIAKAWRQGCKNTMTQTCTLDHPGALSFYQRAGFTPVRRSIEVMPDPRMSGLLDPSVRPSLPVL